MFDKICQTHFFNYLWRVENEIGNIIRQLRLSTNQSLKELSGLLLIDISLLSRIERCERLPTKSQLEKLCEVFPSQSHQLQVSWLSSKILSDITEYDSIALEAIQIAEETIKYKTKHQPYNEL